jgi:hypothetical protein
MIIPSVRRQNYLCANTDPPPLRTPSIQRRPAPPMGQRGQQRGPDTAGNHKSLFGSILVPAFAASHNQQRGLIRSCPCASDNALLVGIHVANVEHWADREILGECNPLRVSHALCSRCNIAEHDRLAASPCLLRFIPG